VAYQVTFWKKKYVMKMISLLNLTLLLTFALGSVVLADTFKCTVWRTYAGRPSESMVTAFFKTYAEAAAWGSKYTANLPRSNNTMYSSGVEKIT
jgi:hypothetical protein